ncbi:MAG: DNA modification methylase [Treponema sp. CETP13]|nr:MAG: DNA modification methylase [Treponema sp. CETP13]
MINTKTDNLTYCNKDSCSCKENEKYLESQLITYIGNKRRLLEYIGKAIRLAQEKLPGKKLSFLDAFSGSGIVSRYLKSYASEIYSNDIEDYATIINKCYLSNHFERDEIELNNYYCSLKKKLNAIERQNTWFSGVISNLYAPKDDTNIKKGERVFYTKRNANYIDTARQIISEMPIEIQPYFIAPLLSEASIHANTAGVFKGFYKDKETGIGKFGGKKGDALSRITGAINCPFPIFSNYDCLVHILQDDINKIIKDIPLVDIAYLDPPYNQHPYGSNYFMLNIIANNRKPKHISPVSGIPQDWNRSVFNTKKKSLEAFSELVSLIKARFIIVSFNSEGFISLEKMTELLEQHGKVDIIKVAYNAFRGSRNLANRNKHLTEYIYLLEKTR